MPSLATTFTLVGGPTVLIEVSGFRLLTDPRDFNRQCALDCTKQGSPLVVLTDRGTIYVPTSQEMPDRSVRKQLLPFVGKRVNDRACLRTQWHSFHFGGEDRAGGFRKMKLEAW